MINLIYIKAMYQSNHMTKLYIYPFMYKIAFLIYHTKYLSENLRKVIKDNKAYLLTSF